MLLKDRSETSETPVITMTEYQRLADRFGIRDKQELSSITSQLYKSGSIIHFSNIKHLQNVVILNPQWLFKVFASVITMVPHWANAGIVDEGDFIHLWKKYHPSIHTELVNLLITFELAYMFEGDAASLLSVIRGNGEIPFVVYRTDTSKAKFLIVPSILPQEYPAKQIAQFWDSFSDASSPTLARLIYLGFFPLGHFSRLLSRVLPLVTRIIAFWANGIVADVSVNGEKGLLLLEQFASPITDDKLYSLNRDVSYPNTIMIAVRSQSLRSSQTIFVEIVYLLYDLFSELSPSLFAQYGLKTRY